MRQYRILAAMVMVGTALLAGCGTGSPPPAEPGQVRIGVLLTAHGSQSSDWVGMIEALADDVREPLLEIPGISGVRLAFITESAPDIASQMRAFDKEQYDEVVVVPLFIAVESQRTNNYLQYLTGMRSDMGQIKQLEKEGFEIYYPRARVSLTQALNESGVLKRNVLRRVKALKGDESGEDMGVLLVGYGDQAFGQQMQETMEGLGRYLKIKTDVDTVAYAFCGELVDYSGEPIV
ncbi:MAG: sirohydrochlorin chelatase, partial [Woeseiaceae bacterium]